MTTTAETLLRDALTLDADQRAVVANALFESLDGEAGTASDAAWQHEASRRLDDIRRGEVELEDADEHYARLRASLRQ
ncbi:addiction module protein [uncultured Tessaracoccus sp.]|uniref:addiction module protein n=1 Tax=uncultured Tessaracoccus sp. TaxID=905023 RepID=UPI00262E0DB2|nr:addiction module protein [uncultured Tessaracoccus sp.]